MEFDIKPNKPTRQDSMMPQTIEQLIKKYKLDSMWDNIQQIVNEVLQHADFIKAGTLTGDRIKGGTLKLGGENNTNGSIQVADATDNNLVTISKDGLVLDNGTKLIGNGGVLSVLSFPAMEWKQLGYSILVPYSPEYETIDIGVYIPNNFTIVSAQLVVQLHPVKWSYQFNNPVTGDIISGSEVGYPCDINLYYQRLLNGNVTPINIRLASELYDYRWLKDNTNKLSCNGSAGQIITHTSKDLTDFLSKGNGTLFQLRTSKPVNSFASNQEWGDYDKNRAIRTGYARAMINVYGYIN